MKTKIVAGKPATLDTTDVARILKIEVGSVRRLIAANQLRAIRVGRLWRVPTVEMERFLSGEGASA